MDFDYLNQASNLLGSSSSVNPVGAIAGVFGDFLNFGTNVANMAINDYWRNKEFGSNDYWRNVAQGNYREQMDFQKYVYGEQKEREDNAIQRRVRDMQAAGLNPVNALGASASASASTVAMPHFNPQSSSPILMRQVSFDNSIKLAQLSMQQKLNDANVRLLDSEASLNQVNADDKLLTREGRIEKLENDIKAVQQSIAESRAREKNTDVQTENVKLQNQMLSNKLVESNWRADVFRLIEQTEGKKLTRKQKKQIYAQLSAQSYDNQFKTSMTVQNYVDSVGTIASSVSGKAIQTHAISDLYQDCSKIGFIQ